MFSFPGSVVFFKKKTKKKKTNYETTAKNKDKIIFQIYILRFGIWLNQLRQERYYQKLSNICAQCICFGL